MVENRWKEVENRMLTGEYRCTVDVKGRMNFPARFRDEVGLRFVVARWLDHALAVMPEDRFDAMIRELTEKQPVKARGLKRFFYSGATVVEPDKQGRILLPQTLREYAGLEKDAVVIGVGDKAEIWSAENWKTQNESFNADEMAALMEEMEL